MSDWNEIPDLTHWKTTMEFSIEQAALLMAGIDPFDFTLAEVKSAGHPRWKKAHGHALGIESAIRQGLISPVVCRGIYCGEDWNNGERYTRPIKPTDRDVPLARDETIITRASLLGWVESENVPIARIPRRVSPPMQAPAVQPAMPEPVPELLPLPYQGHTSEGLEFVDDAIKQLWSTYDPDDPRTAPTQEEVISHLRERGAGANMADAVNLVLRPASLRRGGNKRKKVPTREGQ
ncbi:hypothetical protein NNO07_06165 [Pseudomonas resinovorans]|uniref:Uncharacterized protein n=1 Tax=Metapseudomonas resinovorans TaxID=53412 RepID=A0ABT4Y1E2_METRE|nr:hypothetical protein [Pseudomonas resinovorans]MDA8482648.1 hypothetical protein [Pseudomonas resinovorans]